MTTIRRRGQRARSKPRSIAPADLEAAVEALGIDIRRGDDNEITGMCPMHLQRTGKQDRHPSWSVNRLTGFHNCFSCGYKGNFLQLVMDLRFKNDAFAAARWIRQFGVNLEQQTETFRITWEDRREEPEVEDVDIDLAGRFAMFEAPPDWACEARKVSAESCTHYGVRWDPQKENWILPIRRADDGAILGWQVKAQDGRFFRNFPAGVPKGRCLFGYDVFPEGAPALLVESPLDVVRIHTAGITGALATYGAEWTDAQMKLVLDVSDELILGFDNDAGGHKATELLLHGDPKTKRKGYCNRLQIFLANYKGIKGKDPGDMTDAQIRRWAETSQYWLSMQAVLPRWEDRRR